MGQLENLKKDLSALANKEKATLLSGFFKTAPGQYGAGDVFIGVMVPEQRKVAKEYHDLPLTDVVRLVHSKEHEYRLTALIILADQYSCAHWSVKNKIYDIYLANTKWINNWDLVDLSAPRIVGDFLVNRNKKPLTKLAHSKDLWERRIAIISTLAFIKEREYAETFRIAKILLKDDHDLIHKAVGWMLREVGKRCGHEDNDALGQVILTKFLDKYYTKMPRTMLRYAIERLSPSQKRKYMKK